LWWASSSVVFTATEIGVPPERMSQRLDSAGKEPARGVRSYICDGASC